MLFLDQPRRGEGPAHGVVADCQNKHAKNKLRQAATSATSVLSQTRENHRTCTYAPRQLPHRATCLLD